MKKIYLLLLSLLIVIAGCEKEDNAIEDNTILEEETGDTSVSLNYISGKDIPDIIKFINPKFNSASKSTLVSTPIGYIEIENILHVIDSLGNQNYSFLVLPETPKPNSIFNLVVSTSGKNEQNIAILEYRMNNEFADSYREGVQDFSQFSGIIYKYPFTSFSSLFKESCVQNIDEIVICDEVPVVNGGTGSGSGGGTGYDPTGNEDGYYDGSTGGGGGGSVIIGWKCDRWGVMHDAPTACGSGVWIITFLSHLKSSTSSNKSLTCCDDSYVEGSLGVNLLVNAVSDIYDCIGTTSSEMGVLGSMENARKTIKLSMYLKNNNCSEEAQKFGALAKEAIVAGGEVDYEKKLIYNPKIADQIKSRMSTAESAIFENLTTIQQFLYLKAATEAYIYAESFYPRPVRNTKGDAVKHALWNALSTNYIGASLTKQLTDAHEVITYDSNYPNHFKETNMDLFNNAIGRELATQYGNFIFQLVENALGNGELRYLNKLEFNGIFWKATNLSQLTATNQ